MKRRVRGLLHKNWHRPLAALALACLPMFGIAVLLALLLRPSGASIDTKVFQFTFTMEDPMGMLLQLLMLFSDPGLLLQPMMGWLPTQAVMAGIHVFVAMPIYVSLASYFLSFLRGKNPSVLSVYNVFSGRYPRALGGMAYMLLWQVIWLLVSFVLPTALILGSVPIISEMGLELNIQIYAFIGVLVISLLWYIVFFFVFINRMLAYSLTAVCIAAQPRLPAYRAVRLSRKLMRGCKWRLIGLFLSFANYFLPAIIAAVLLPLLAIFGAQLGLSGIMLRSIRTFLIVLIAANQLVWVYVAPYMAATYHAFYIERKREALMDEEVTPDDFAAKEKADKPERASKGKADA